MGGEEATTPSEGAGATAGTGATGGLVTRVTATLAPEGTEGTTAAPGPEPTEASTEPTTEEATEEPTPQPAEGGAGCTPLDPSTCKQSLSQVCMYADATYKCGCPPNFNQSSNGSCIGKYHCLFSSMTVLMVTAANFQPSMNARFLASTTARPTRPAPIRKAVTHAAVKVAFSTPHPMSPKLDLEGFASQVRTCDH